MVPDNEILVKRRSYIYNRIQNKHFLLHSPGNLEVHTAKVICQCMPYFKVKDVYFVCIALTVTSFALYISNRLCSLENSNNMYRGHVMEYIDVVTDAFLGGKIGQTTDNSCCYITYKKCPLYKSNRTKPLIYIWNN